MAFWEAFEPALKAVGQIVEQHVIARATLRSIGHNCPQCGSPLVERQSPRGPFAGCSGYPACKFTADLQRYAGAAAS